MHIARTILPTVLAAGLLSVAFAQIDLTSFEAGDPIVADEVNANFEELATAVQSVASGTANVTALDMLMLNGAAGLTPDRSKSHYLGAIARDGEVTGCYGANFDLPDGATITSVSATMDLSVGSAANDASAQFWHRSWTSTNSTVIADLSAFNSDTGYVTQTISGPFAEDPDAMEVKADEREYAVTVCLTEDARFFHAQVAYEIP